MVNSHSEVSKVPGKHLFCLPEADGWNNNNNDCFALTWHCQRPHFISFHITPKNKTKQKKRTLTPYCSKTRHKHNTYLKYLEKCPHVEAMNTKRHSKYSWHNYQDKQKSQQHRDGDAKTPAEQAVSRPRKPGHTVSSKEDTESSEAASQKVPFKATVTETKAVFCIRTISPNLTSTAQHKRHKKCKLVNTTWFLSSDSCLKLCFFWSLLTPKAWVWFWLFEISLRFTTIIVPNMY